MSATIALTPALANALVAPIGRTLPRKADQSLTDFATAVNTLATTGRMDVLVEALNQVATIAPEAGIYAEPSIAQRTPSTKRNKPVIKEAKKEEKKPVNLLPNYDGRMMACDEGTASAGQRKWLKENTDMTAADIKTISMVDASNWRAYVTGKITAEQYNRLP